MRRVGWGWTHEGSYRKNETRFHRQSMTIAIFVLLWISSNLSWTSAAWLFTLWLLCPFGMTWSWPEGKPLSIWRTIISWLAIFVVSVVAAVPVHSLTKP